MPRKRIDPKQAALLDRQVRLRQQFEKDYSRMMRAVRRMEKARQALARIGRRLSQLDGTPAP